MLVLQEMRERGISPPEGRIGQMAHAAALHGEVRLAVDLLTEEEGKYGGVVELQAWVDVLRCSAERYYVSTFFHKSILHLAYFESNTSSKALKSAGSELLELAISRQNWVSARLCWIRRRGIIAPI